MLTGECSVCPDFPPIAVNLGLVRGASYLRSITIHGLFLQLYDGFTKSLVFGPIPSSQERYDWMPNY